MAVTFNHVIEYDLISFVPDANETRLGIESRRAFVDLQTRVER